LAQLHLFLLRLFHRLVCPLQFRLRGRTISSSLSGGSISLSASSLSFRFGSSAAFRFQTLLFFRQPLLLFRDSALLGSSSFTLRRGFAFTCQPCFLLPFESDQARILCSLHSGTRRRGHGFASGISLLLPQRLREETIRLRK
jgi:hypothetical protein